MPRHKQPTANKTFTNQNIESICPFCGSKSTLYNMIHHLKTKKCIVYRTNLYIDPILRKEKLDKFLFMIKINKDKNRDLNIGTHSIITNKEYEYILTQIND